MAQACEQLASRRLLDLLRGQDFTMYWTMKTMRMTHLLLLLLPRVFLSARTYLPSAPGPHAYLCLCSQRSRFSIASSSLSTCTLGPQSHLEPQPSHYSFILLKSMSSAKPSNSHLLLKFLRICLRRRLLNQLWRIVCVGVVAIRIFLLKRVVKHRGINIIIGIEAFGVHVVFVLGGEVRP